MSKNNNIRARKKQSPRATDQEDFEFELKEQLPPKIPEGEYQVEFLRKEVRTLWKAQKLILWFRILDFGEINGVQIFMACSMPEGNKWGPGYKFLRAYALATGRLPDRFDRVSTKVFRGKIFIAEVRTVTKNSQQKDIPPAAQYSIISNLTSVEQ